MLIRSIGLPASMLQSVPPAPARASRSGAVHSIDHENANALRALDRAFAAAFTRGDAAALSALFDENATYDDVDGGHHEGRADIHDALEAELDAIKGRGESATMQALAITVEAVGSNTYRVHEYWKLTFTKGDKVSKLYAQSNGTARIERDAAGRPHPVYTDFVLTPQQ